MTNPRYRHFQQELFTVGDYEQFVSNLREFRLPMKQSSKDNNEKKSEWDKLFEHERWTWSKYRCGPDILSTFEYMFHKFKKGIYVQIVDNHINIFLPFSNVDYRNEYESYFSVDPRKYKSFEDLYKKLCEIEGRDYLPNRVCWYKNQWYCNNGLVRYEYPIKENDSGVNMIYDMLNTLCQERTIPDCEFFINKRDFPLLSLYDEEPYTALVPEHTPLFSYNQEYYLPILGMCTRDDLADIPIPTWEDWSRVAFQKYGRLFGKLFREYPDEFHRDWDSKKSTVVFRGSSTGLGTTPNTNPRLFFTLLSDKKRYHKNGELYLDIGITKINARPRKCVSTDYLDVPDLKNIHVINPMTPVEQSQYKYILHLPGHSCAYRLATELGMGSVVFIYPHENKLWYSDLLEPYVHYIPLEKGLDETEIYEKMDWCEDHPEEAKKIAQNARLFYEKYLCFDGILDYMTHVLSRLSSVFDFSRPKYENMEKYFVPLRLEMISPDIIDIQCGDIDDTQIIKETKRTRVFSDDEYIIKKKHDADLSHSHFISKVLENDLSGLCSNFMFSESISKDSTMLRFKKHKDPFVSLYQYLMSTSFRMLTFKNILLQIIYSLNIAQIRSSFIHYDLMPWNILLYKTMKNERSIPFVFFDKTIILQGCEYKAMIMDFEYSAVRFKDQMIHKMLPFFWTEDHDMITLLFNTFVILLKHQKLSKQDIQWIRQVFYFTTGKEFTTMMDLKHFLIDHSKFSNIILSSEKKHDPRMRGSNNGFLNRFLGSCFPNLQNVLMIQNITNDWTRIRLKSLKIQFYEDPDPVQQLRHAYSFQKLFEDYEKSTSLSFMSPSHETQGMLFTVRSQYQKSCSRLVFCDEFFKMKTLDTNKKEDRILYRWYPFTTTNKITVSPEPCLLDEWFMIVYLYGKDYCINKEVYKKTKDVLHTVMMIR